MPRQIIDTESSRPRYVRRVLLMTVLAVVIAAVVLGVGFEAWIHLAHAPVPGK